MWFWVAKLLTTDMGETTWDWSANTLGPVPAIALGALGFVLALAAQLRARRYQAWIYWCAVVMVSVFGTTVADAVHVVLGVPYAVSTVVFAVAVLVTFALWYRVEGTLFTRAVTTRRRELFYWSVVILTFPLGTAAGDLAATTLGLGYAASIAVSGCCSPFRCCCARPHRRAGHGCGRGVLDGVRVHPPVGRLGGRLARCPARASWARGRHRAGVPDRSARHRGRGRLAGHRAPRGTQRRVRNPWRAPTRPGPLCLRAGLADLGLLASNTGREHCPAVETGEVAAALRAPRARGSSRTAGPGCTASASSGLHGRLDVSVDCPGEAAEGRG